MQSVRTILLGAALLAVTAERAAAQATYDACYVPSVGAIYLIKQAGLPTACLAQNHVAFSWTSGGAVADGSITLAKLAFDPATQTELNAVLAQLAATGTINASANPVDWTQLKNVPAGLADGVDDGGGTASDLVCTSCVAASDLANSAVTTAKLANAAVTAAKLAFDPATQTEMDSVTAGLATAGTINASTNPVDWTQLKNVPAGFADGVDAGAGGTSDHGGLTGLTDDDHPQYLMGNAARAAVDGFAVTGTFGTGTLAATGGGTRLLWYPRKGAFRAGVAFGTAWDDANIGLHSVALGGTPMARGDFSVALGTGAIAGGAYSTAIGAVTSASADSSTALGARTTANGIGATALGLSTTASGRASLATGTLTLASDVGATAMGFGSIASGPYSTAIGRARAEAQYATALGDFTAASGVSSTAMGTTTAASGLASTAMGSRTAAIGIVSTAMGSNTTASGNVSTAMGNSTTASGALSVAMGDSTIAQAYLSVVIGRNNFAQGSPTSWVDSDPLFVAGTGGSPSSRFNALLLRKNGNLTITGTLTQSSDLRFKEAIEPLGNALDGVLRLQPIRYRFREGTGHPTDRQIGLGAQDVERIFPELVHRDAQGYLSVAYTQLAAVLVRAIQEQQQMIEALRAEVAALRATQQR